jgi:hypothetical protein
LRLEPSRAKLSGKPHRSIQVALHQVEVAVLWLVRDSHSGLLRSPTQADGDQQHQQRGDDAKQQQEQEKQQQQEANPSLDPESEALITNALTHAQGETIGVALSVIDSGGQVSEASVQQLAARLNLEPAQARAQIEKVRDAYVHEAVTHTAKVTGTNDTMAREALAAAEQRNPSAYRQAAEEHFSTGRPAYDTFVREYVAELDKTDPGSILNAAPVPGYSTLLRFPDKTEMACLPLALFRHCKTTKRCPLTSAKQTLLSDRP